MVIGSRRGCDRHRWLFGIAVGVGHGYGVAVGVGLEAATTVKLTVIDDPLVPVPPVPLHGVAAKV